MSQKIVYIVLALVELSFLGDCHLCFGAKAADLSLSPMCKIENKRSWVSVSGFCHLLLFYRSGPIQGIPSVNSCEEIITSLTDERIATSTFGGSPLVATRHGVRYYLIQDSVANPGVGEVHQDQCLATFADLGLPLSTPIYIHGKTYSISNLLNESVANFFLEQDELTWSALAYAKYLPPLSEWRNRFGVKVNFSMLICALVGKNPKIESCYGLHILQAVGAILDADGKHAILDGSARTKAVEYINTMLGELPKTQGNDGSWGQSWSSPEGGSRQEAIEMRFLVTGHILDICNEGKNLHIPTSVRARALAWLKEAQESDKIRSNVTICPYTHATRAIQRSEKDKEEDLRIKISPANVVGD